jgi:ribosome biogenesis GTPase
LERYLTLAWESGATPIIVLTKADLCHDVQVKKMEVEALAVGVPVHVTSSTTKQGIHELQQYFDDGKTVALLGSSGVGKSTLTNLLLGYNKQTVNDVRGSDDKGRHTTTSRDLIVLERGMIIDTPGLREIQLWSSDDALSHTFEDIMELAKACRFRDCSHESEPGCAVKRGLENGELSRERYQSYLKLNKEISYLQNAGEYLRKKEEKMKMYRHQAAQQRKNKKG